MQPHPIYTTKVNKLVSLASTKIPTTTDLKEFHLRTGRKVKTDKALSTGISYQ